MQADLRSFLIYASVLALTLLAYCLADRRTLKSTASKILWAALLAIPLSLLAGLRYGVGTDYYTYVEVFDRVRPCNLIEYLKDARLEPLFLSLLKLMTTLHFSNGMVFGAFEFITLFIVNYILLCEKNRLNPVFAFCYYYFLFFHSSLNVFRQILAVSMVLYGFYKLLEDKKCTFVIWVLIATLFHSSAIITISFLPIYLIWKRKEPPGVSRRLSPEEGSTGGSAAVKRRVRGLSRWELVYCILILLSPLIISALFRLMLSFPIFSKYSTYMLDEKHFGIWGIFTVILEAFPLALYCRRIMQSRDMRIMLGLYLVHFPLIFISAYSSWSSRLQMYFDAVNILFIPRLTAECRSAEVRKAMYLYYMLLLLFIHFVTVLVRGYGGTYPYMSLL